MQLPRICAYANAENVGSRRILAKVGLRLSNEFIESGVRCVWYEADAPR